MDYLNFPLLRLRRRSISDERVMDAFGNQSEGEDVRPG